MLFGESLIRMDPPEHTGMRQLVNPAFHASSIERLRPRAEALCERYLDAVDTRHFDFVRDFAFPFPVTVIAELLGVPPADRPRFRRWVDALIPAGTSDPFEKPRTSATTDGEDLREEITAYFDDLLERRRQAPQDDLMTLLLHATVHGEPLTQEAIVGFAVLLLIAGHVTTTNLLANGALWLALHPETLDFLRGGGEDALRPFVEEVLRFWSPVQRMSRYTVRPVRLREVELPAGRPVVAWIASANRDPAKFPDPDTFRPDRRPNPHLAFGFGIHTCLGAPLARLEATVAFRQLLRRYRRFETSEALAAPRRRGILYGLDALPLRVWGDAG